MTLEELEQTILHLPAEQLSQFREWFLEFDSETWDRQLGADVAAGRLDLLAEEAIREHRDGESTTL